MDEILKLIELAYSAALDDNQWQAWTAAAVTVLDGAGGTLSILDTETGSIRKMISIGWTHVEEEFLSHWWQFDPLVPAVLKAKGAAAFLDTDHVDLEDKHVAEYMAWQRGVGGLDHHMAATLPLNNGKLKGNLSVHRFNEAGHTPPAELQKLKQLLPHIAGAFSLGFRHKELLLDSFWDGASQFGGSDSAFLLDENRNIVRVTYKAETLVARASVLGCKERQIFAVDPSDDDKLQACISKALASPNTAGSIRIRSAMGRPDLIVSVYPLVRSARFLVPVEAAALVTINDLGARPRNKQVEFETILDLTPKEATLCQLLSEGHSPESAANAMEVRMPTVRTHLRNIFRKTSTSRQAELLSFLGRL